MRTSFSWTERTASLLLRRLGSQGDHSQGGQRGQGGQGGQGG